MRKLPPITQILSDGDWDGSAALIYGGGSSLSDVRMHIADRCPGVQTIGINWGWTLRPDLVLISDRQVFELIYANPVFYTQYGHLPEETIQVTHEQSRQYDELPQRFKSLKYVKITSKVRGGTLADGLYPAGDTGTLALLLANALGADPVYLIGFDCRGEDGQTTNWHDAYPESWKQRADAIYPQVIREMERVAPHLECRVINVESFPGASALECFEKLSAEKLAGHFS